MRHLLRDSAFVTMSLFALGANAAPPESTGEVQPAETQRQRWDAAEDMQRLEGRWKLADPFAENSLLKRAQDYKNPILNAVIAGEAILDIKEGKFSIHGTDISGTVSNANNAIEFRPINDAWANVDEPLLKFARSEESLMTVSYVAKAKSITFRHPAHSCSRSGIRITFQRIAADEAADSPANVAAASPGIGQ